MKKTPLILSPAMCAALIVPLGASTLPPASYTITIGHFVGLEPTFNTDVYSVPTSFSYTGPGEIAQFVSIPELLYGYAGINAGLGHDEATALIQATNTIQPPHLLNENAMVVSLGATTTYYATVVAKPSVANPQPTIPYIVSASGSARCSGSYDPSSLVTALAYVDIGVQQYGQVSCGGLNSVGPLSFSTTQKQSFALNTPVQILMVAGGTITAKADPYNPTLTGAFEASADPTFTIDPSFPFADDYELLLSDASPVPEPSLELTTGALISLCFVLRKMTPVAFKR